MNSRNVYWLALLLLVAGCRNSDEVGSAESLIAQIDPGNEEAKAPRNRFGFSENLEQGPDLFAQKAPLPMAETPDQEGAKPARPQLAVERVQSAPEQQIAYSYGLGFRIASDRIAELQQTHTALCEAMRDKCRILRVSQAKTDYDGLGEITLQVAANEAGALQKALVEPARKLGGDIVSSVRNGEDLTDDIVDTEARLQSRLVLRAKLTEILRGNKGSVDELIKAEKAVAEVNEEIDATRNRLEGYRTRIRMSDVSIEYHPEFGEAQLGFGRPVMTAARSIGTTLGITIAALIYGVTVLVPVTLFILALRWLLHRFGLRLRFWRKVRPEGEPGS